MAYSPIKLKRWIAFLKHLGLVEFPVKNGSHTKYNYPKGSDKRLPQAVIFRVTSKDIPPLHIQTNLRTLGMTWDEMQEIMQKNC